MEEQWKGWYENNRTDEKKIAINLNFRCLANYPVNLYGERARSERRLNLPYLMHPAETDMNHEIDWMNDSRSELYANLVLSLTNPVRS
jgi:hypothetical protein